jgi:RES domain-containing protein
MIYRPELLDVLQSVLKRSWTAVVYRHMFGNYSPLRPNVGGARWNSPGLEAIYASLERETALAEAEYYLQLQPTRPKATRTLYKLNVTIGSIVDLTASELLSAVGITENTLLANNFQPSQQIGSAVHWLGYDALLVPSVRRQMGTNLVIFEPDPARLTIEITEAEIIAEDARS